jgi:hypothetical protein
MAKHRENDDERGEADGSNPARHTVSEISGRLIAHYISAGYLT